ncbi:DUF4174 domain-containing protein [Ferrimonas balearica]|uniref:DUF4174 domain-containing protein n=1 Tax=Ferrimonas balearica TaxID=44012 RepID=UPI001C583EB5|nr:DUF4174 domain-containing protein [Ferrimonas balearica]MBW3165808.1 DUF4174 domain-containing protein [Ferrimonas balearica]MBY6019103.1 DUF4174 domain-containing protein [Halomonas denitrificans]MBY6095707.1 DUF4174 domain-containing protein [Ferrimonas balearica]MBY6225324.1 DUF4174 domain-containing protein [Ferrimonas balearica]
MFTFLLSLIGRGIGLAILMFSLHPTVMPVTVQGDPLNSLRWHHRALVVFTPTDQHPHWQDQQAHLDGMLAGLRERDLLVFEVVGESVSMEGRDLPHSDAQQWREDFIAPNDRFTLVLIGKDGEVKMHQDRPVDEAELFELIDAMPMRMHERGMGRM